jgi:hypothetical protein
LDPLRDKPYEFGETSNIRNGKGYSPTGGLRVALILCRFDLLLIEQIVATHPTL